MIISKIEIENFLSFYKTNTFLFDVGPSIIIGQNNTGKSKLFDAFNWVLFDRAFKTEEEKWDITKNWGEELLNRHAAKDCDIGSYVPVSVCLYFYDEEGNKYLLTREFEAVKEEINSWSIPNKTDLTLTKTEAKTKNDINYYDKNAEDHLNRLFPSNLSRYFLFQGENISQILSLSSRSHFSKALRDLSRIEVFEMAKNYASKVFKRLDSEFNQKEDKDIELQKLKESLKAEITKAEKDIEELINNSDIISDNRDIAKNELEKLNSELHKYEECAVILEEINEANQRLKDLNESRSTYIKKNESNIFDSWLYGGSENIINNFISLYQKNKKEKKFPEPIRQEFIKEMLSEEKCLVCETAAKKGSKEYLAIKKHLDEKSLDAETEFIQQLSGIAETYLNGILKVPQEIKQYYHDIEAFDNRIKELNDRIKGKEIELHSVIPNDLSRDDIKLVNFQKIKSGREKIRIEISNLDDMIRKTKGKIELREEQLKEYKSKYSKILEKSSNRLELLRRERAEKIKTITETIYIQFNNELIADIEKSANEYFKRMTSKNLAMSGEVKVDHNNNEVYIVDDVGERQYNINQANKVSLQISFVAAVLKVSNKFWEMSFPFIADAPISALGGNNKIMAVETIKDIFEQSIIILKDDAITGNIESIRNDPIRIMIKNDDGIKNAYELSLIGDNVSEQDTNNERLI
jgi:DNA sulfur modification protein DndD